MSDGKHDGDGGLKAAAIELWRELDRERLIPAYVATVAMQGTQIRVLIAKDLPAGIQLPKVVNGWPVVRVRKARKRSTKKPTELRHKQEGDETCLPA